MEDEAVQGVEVDYKDKDLFKLVTRTTENLEVGTITVEQDLKLMLLRHWSLQESIHNSNYVIAQLSLARDPGQQRYTELLARIGIPLVEAK